MIEDLSIMYVIAFLMGWIGGSPYLVIIIFALLMLTNSKV